MVAGAVTRSPGVTLLWHHLRLFKLHHERSKLLQEVKVVYFILCLHITSRHPPGLVTQSKDQIHSRCCQDRWKPAVCDIIHSKLKKPWTRHSPCPCILFLWNEYNRCLRQGEGGGTRGWTQTCDKQEPKQVKRGLSWGNERVREIEASKRSWHAVSSWMKYAPKSITFFRLERFDWQEEVIIQRAKGEQGYIKTYGNWPITFPAGEYSQT